MDGILRPGPILIDKVNTKDMIFTIFYFHSGYITHSAIVITVKVTTGL